MPEPYLLNQAKPTVGGQAVLEGVMMRSPKSFVVAVRRGDGRIVVREQKWETLLSSIKPMRWPGLRGAIVLVESLWNGLSALNFSAEQAMPQEGEGSGNSSEGEAKNLGPAKPSAKQKAALAFTLVISLGLGLALFVGAPHLLTWLLGLLLGVSLSTSSFSFHAIDGVFKAAIFLGYIAIIARMPDIKRVFQYHGAEHKAIWAHEAGELTVERAMRESTKHPRCGTSFILIVLMMSILLFAMVFPFIPKVSDVALLNHLAMIGIKMPLMFPLAGLSYELQRYSAKKLDSGSSFWKWLVVPGFLMQKLTTSEPTKDQVEIAIVALSRALALESGNSHGDEVKVFGGFDEAIVP